MKVSRVKISICASADDFFDLIILFWNIIGNSYKLKAGKYSLFNSILVINIYSQFTQKNLKKHLST